MALSQIVKELILGLMGGEPSRADEVINGLEGGQNAVQADGSVPFTAPQAGVTPIVDADLATKLYVDNSSGGGGANTSLSNLDSVAINTDLQFAVSQVLTTQNTIGISPDLDIRSGNSSTDQTGHLYISTGDGDSGSGPAIFGTGGANTSGNTGSLQIYSGNSTAGNSGDIQIATGGAAGTRGKISFVDGSEGASGKVWTSTDTQGSGHWATASGGASIALDNLASTAVNSDIVPGVNNSVALGSTSFNWASIESLVYNVYDGANGKFGSLSATDDGSTVIPSGGGSSEPLVYFSAPGASAQGNLALVTGGGPHQNKIFIETGNGSANLINIQTGTSSGDLSGAISLTTGNTDYISGGINLTTGNGGSTFNSGDITFTIGAAPSGTKGKIKFKDGSEGTAGQVWTSTGTLGEGSWADAPYTPSDSGKWNGDPTTVKEALDRIAAVVGNITPIP